MPPVPRLSTFPELNVRTYVTRDGKPGIWFFSLDAGSTLAVEGAKRLYRLPYHRARMTCRATLLCRYISTAVPRRANNNSPDVNKRPRSCSTLSWSSR